MRQAGKQRTASVKRALFKVLIVGTLVPAALIWAVGHVTAQSAVTFMWDGLSRRIADLVVVRARNYLETGPTALDMNDAAVLHGRVDPADRRDMLRYLLAGLQANPNVTWYTFAGEDGAYLSAYRHGEGVIRLTWRDQEGPEARYRDFLVGPDGEFEALPEVTKPYDPRTRAWYEKTIAQEGAVWSPPFLFASGPPGFILSRRVLDAEGELIGVWGIEYEMSYVSEFLSKLEVGCDGRAYLVTDAGEVIGHPLAAGRIGEPDGWIVVDREGKRVIATAADHRDPWLRTAYAESVAHGAPEHHFSFEREGQTYLAISRQFPAESGLPWRILVVIPECDILGSIDRNTLIAAGIAALIAAVVLSLGLAYARRRLSRPLTDIAHDLDLMARLEIEEAPRVARSSLTEVEGMVAARERMRGGLRSFMKYVPAQLVRDLFAAGSEARLGGETRRLTILFSDVADFTSVAEELDDPETLVQALSRYFQVMSATIADCAGTVDKYIGDAVMAFWGAPIRVDDHAVQACRAAWACQRGLEALRQESSRVDMPPFYTRIGVNTGPAVVGNIGWAERMNYTAMGDAVNVASRLEGICSLYGIEIAISSDTWREVKDEFLARPVDYVGVKGRKRPLVVYELLGPRDTAGDDVVDFAQRVTQGFKLYRRRAFAEAQAAFEAALASRPGDTGCEKLAKRCAQYVAEPPPDDWTGAVTLTQKR